MSDTIEFTDSTGNIFADLGLPNPEERLLKADLAIQIKQLLDLEDLTGEAAATRLGLNTQRVEDMRIGRLADFSLDQLLQCVKRLGRRIEVRISTGEYSPEDATLTVIAA